MGESDKLCAHLLSLGIQAEILPRHSLEEVGITRDMLWSGRIWRESLGSVQVVGKRIGYINIISERMESERSYHEVGRFLEYLVTLKEIPSSLCWAVLVAEERGLLRRKVIDIDWRGGSIAEKLNSESTLKQNLLMEFQLSGPLNVVIAPEPIYQCIRIETPHRLPSANFFDCLELLARHIPQHVTELNSRPETVLLESKIEFNPHFKDDEIADLYVTDRCLRINSKKSFQIPLYMVDDCDVLSQRVYEAASRQAVNGYMVALKYFDESGHRRKVEFRMHTGAVFLRDTIRTSYRYGISR